MNIKIILSIYYATFLLVFRYVGKLYYEYFSSTYFVFSSVSFTSKADWASAECIAGYRHTDSKSRSKDTVPLASPKAVEAIGWLSPLKKITYCCINYTIIAIISSWYIQIRMLYGVNQIIGQYKLIWSCKLKSPSLTYSCISLELNMNTNQGGHYEIYICI